MKRAQIQRTVDIIEAVGIALSKETAPSIVWKFIASFSLYLSLDILVGMVSVTNTQDFYQFVKPLPYIAGSLVVQGGNYFLFHHRKLIGKLMYEMDRHFYTYPDEEWLGMKYVWYLREENIVVFITLIKYVSLSFLFVICVPVLGELLYYGRIKTFIYPVWAPWSMDSVQAELVVSAIQFLQGFCGLWYNHINMVFVSVVVTEFCRQYERLIAAVSSLESRTVSSAVESKNFDRILRENIIHCIRHYQALHKNFKIFEIWFSTFFSIELAVCGVTLTFALYIAMNASTLTQIFNFFPVVFFIWTGLLVRCMIGEIFPQLNERLAESLVWDTPWYKTNKENRTLLGIFHSDTTCRPLRLHGLSIFEASRETFGKLVRMTYSFYNVLKQFGQKNQKGKCTQIPKLTGQFEKFIRHPKMQRKPILLAASVIETVGIKIFKQSNPRNVWKLILSLSLHILVDILAGMVLLTNTDDFDKFVTPIPAIAGSIVVQCGTYFIYHHKTSIGELLYQMDANFYTYPDEQSFRIDYPWYLQEGNIVLLITLIKYASLSTLFAICVPILAELLYYGRIKTFIYPIWTPWPIDNLKEEVSVTLFQIAQGFCGVWFGYVNMIFLFIVVVEFVRQYRKLIAAVSSLEWRSRTERNSVQGGGGFDAILRENIVRCIRHHQILHKNFWYFKVWFSIFFSIELAISTITFSFGLWVAMNASSVGQMLNYFPVVSFIWINILVRCWISEIFPRLDENLAETIPWHTPWFNSNNQNERMLRMFHSAAVCNPLRLHGLSIFEATRVTFGKLVRMTYSFYNVLKRKNQ